MEPRTVEGLVSQFEQQQRLEDLSTRLAEKRDALQTDLDEPFIAPGKDERRARVSRAVATTLVDDDRDMWEDVWTSTHEDHDRGPSEFLLCLCGYTGDEDDVETVEEDDDEIKPDD